MAIGEPGGKDEGEDDPEDETGEHGVEQGPADADDAPFVAQGKFAPDEEADQLVRLNGLPRDSRSFPARKF